MTESRTGQDKRTGQPAIPDNIEDWLNHTQQQILKKIEGLGFKLIFMRRPVFQDPIPVVINDKGNKIGILETDGRLNMEPDLVLRSKKAQVKDTAA